MIDKYLKNSLKMYFVIMFIDYIQQTILLYQAQKTEQVELNTNKLFRCVPDLNFIKSLSLLIKLKPQGLISIHLHPAPKQVNPIWNVPAMIFNYHMWQTKVSTYMCQAQTEVSKR